MKEYEETESRVAYAKLDVEVDNYEKKNRGWLGCHTTKSSYDLKLVL